MALNNVFVDIKLHDSIIIFPWQLNNELYLHLKNNLKNKVEKKCIDIGYVCKVYDIIDYKNGYLLAEDLTGNSIFNVTYNAKVCIPLPNTQVICKIDQIFKSVVMAKNGPIIAVIKFTDINPLLFALNNSGNIMYKKTNKVLSVNDHIKITIRSKRSYNGDNHIGVVGFIDDLITSESESNKYMFKEYEDDNNDEIRADNKTFTTLNEDETVEVGVEPINNNSFVLNI
jgi:DNA-directed RNA polymerase subunit E'/Rpb7